MRSVWIALLLLLLMIGGITVNAAYINNVANTMNRMLDNLPDVGEESCTAASAELRDYWEEQVPYVGLSVGYTITDRVSEQAAVLFACAECGDFYGYRSALALLRDAVGDMSRLEKWNLENLV